MKVRYCISCDAEIYDIEDAIVDNGYYFCFECWNCSFLYSEEWEWEE